MKKKEIKKERKYSENHVAMLIEDMHSQFKIFGEGQKDTERKIDSLKDDFNDFKDRLDKFDVRLSNVEDKVVANNLRTSSITYKVEEIKRDIKIVINLLEDIFQKLKMKLGQ